jgi:hypothetical protein
VADDIIEWAASVGAELEVTAFGISGKDALALKRSADSFGDALNQLL